MAKVLQLYDDDKCIAVPVAVNHVCQTTTTDLIDNATPSLTVPR